MTIEQMPARSRRVLLTGAAAGVAVLAAGQLARPLVVRAADDEPVLVGHSYHATGTTAIANTTTSADVFSTKSNNGSAIVAASGSKPAIRAVSDTEVGVSAVSKQHVGIVGYGGEPDGEGGSTGGSGTIGVIGTSGAGCGVAGMCKGGEGVHGSSETGTGVYGQGNEGVHGEGDKAGVFGGSSAGTGVQGRSSTGWGVTGGSEGTEFGASGGVFGMSDRTVGVFGLSAEGIAVEGRSDHEPATGIGVKGYSRECTGVYGESGKAVGVEGVTLGVTTEEAMFQAGVIGVAGRVQGEGDLGIAVFGDGRRGVGVLGQGAHCGVHGYSDNLVGVEGKSLGAGGVGVVGQTTNGTAISANVDEGGSGVAIVAHGPVVFDSAGRATVPAGRDRVTVDARVPLDAGTSKVLVTLLGGARSTGGKPVPVYLSHVEISGTGSFDIVLTAAVRKEVDAAFFIIS